MKMHTSLTHNGRAIDIGGDEGSNVALVHGPFYGGPDNFRELARLFVAAPDLLEALKGLVNRHVDLVNSGDCGFWNPEDEAEVKAARDAIARAEGRS